MTGFPQIIQGGMGAGVSSWRLANAVSRLGQLGVVSGTALDAILARRLQDGDPGGCMRRALDHFPFPEAARRVWENYFVPGGKPRGRPYKDVPMHSIRPSRHLVELCVVANFVEVFLAREGHDGPVGINYLEKIQLPHLPSLYGAMLAGVGYVLMGAGIPVAIPGTLDKLAKHEEATYAIHVTGARDDQNTSVRFDPHVCFQGDLPQLKRPYFIPIIASNLLASVMLKKSNGRVDGFVVEGPTSGGHNAPPRGKLQLSPFGEPVYGERDRVDLEKIRELGLPFWVAGGCASPEKLRHAIRMGGAGIQVGTAFALSEESGLEEGLKKRLLSTALDGSARVSTDMLASPTGFPFKVVRIEGTLSEPGAYLNRTRVCDLGYLREAYCSADGAIAYRCPAEPVQTYVHKGGDAKDAEGRKCLCNALMANIGLGQVRSGGGVELPLVTCGDALCEVGQFLLPGRSSYGAREVVEKLLGQRL